MSTDIATRLMALFPTYTRSHAFYRPSEAIRERRDDGTDKVSTPKAKTVDKPVSPALWKRHLKGDIVLGIVPVVDDDGMLTTWGAADIDDYAINILDLADKIDRLGLPIPPPYRTKSGGSRIILRTTDPVPVSTMKMAVANIVSRLNLDPKKVEIFPKQDRLDELYTDARGKERQKLGTVLWMPYSGPNFPAIRKSGGELTIEQFADALNTHTMGPDQLADLAVPTTPGKATTNTPDGAAHAAHMLDRYLAEITSMVQGGRNDSLTRIAARVGSMAARGWIDQDTAKKALWRACEENWTNEPREKIRDTLDRQFAWGLLNPHPDLEQPAEPLVTFDHGDTEPVPSRWLIRNRLPETGLAVLSGQWGTFKSFGALDIAASVMTGMHFTAEPVYRRSGVLFIAAEGAGDIPIRLAALSENKIAPAVAEQPELAFNDNGNPLIDPKRLPFRWATSSPLLLDEKAGALPKLVATAGTADDHFWEKHGLPLGLIVIDTMAAAAGWTDENDNAQAAKVMDVLRRLSDTSGALVLVIDHFGKDEQTGTRGASAKEAAADAVLAMLGKRESNGSVSNLRLAIRKLRGGPSGEEFPFEAKIVDMGKDDYGYSLTSRIIDWNVIRAPIAKSKRKPPSQYAFDDAMATAMEKHGQIIRPNGSEVRGVKRQHIRAAFKVVYNTDGKHTAVTQAFRSALNKALDDGQVSVTKIAGEEFLWSDDDRLAEEAGI